MNRFDSLTDTSFLKSGDLVLFASGGSWLDHVRWFRRSAWTHVGLVVRRADDLEPLLWHTQDAVLTPFARRIAHVSGRIGVRCLNHPLDGGQCEQLETLRRDLGRPPEHRLMDLIGAADGSWLDGPEHLGGLSDAELVATVYQGLGLLDGVETGGQSPGRFRPRHFAGSSSLQLKHGYALGPEIILQGPAHDVGWGDLRPQPI